MQLCLTHDTPKLIGISSNSSNDRYACTLEEFVRQWRKTFGQKNVVVCTTEFRSGGNIYEGVGDTGLITENVNEPPYKATGIMRGVEHTDGTLRDVPLSFDMSKMQWFQVGYAIYFLASDDQWTTVGGDRYFKG